MTIGLYRGEVEGVVLGALEMLQARWHPRSVSKEFLFDASLRKARNTTSFSCAGTGLIWAPYRSQPFRIRGPLYADCRTVSVVSVVSTFKAHQKTRQNSLNLGSKGRGTRYLGEIWLKTQNSRVS